MRDSLPSIWINTKNNAEFLEKVREIAANSKRFLVKNVSEGAMSAVNLRFSGTSIHTDLGAQFICFDAASNRIAIEIRAGNWHPSDFPSYDTYVLAAKDLINPILKRYNKNEGAKYRLSIESKEKLEPKLPPLSLKYFMHFTACANKEMLHPFDWGRFYEFVRNDRAKLPAERLAYLLVCEGFSEKKAAYIADVYVHLHEFKRKRTTFEVFQKLGIDGKLSDSSNIGAKRD